MKAMYVPITICLACFTLQAAPWNGIGEPGQGSLIVLDGQSADLNLPLEHTSVQASISGFVARVTVTQSFGNDLDHAVEAVYVFPLPDQAAVDDMTMYIGNTVIRGLIKERSEAQRIYDQARQNGRTASLLTQERPNIFTQSVANILPGDDVRIVISYVQDMKYDRGEYEFNYPMVVGPRFIPGIPAGRQGGGWSDDTDAVPDASRITPPVLEPGTRSGHDISLEVDLNAGVPIQNIHSPSHRIRIERIGESESHVEIAPDDIIPNKDFILRYAVAGRLPESAVLAHAGDLGGFFTLMIQPQAGFEVEEVTPKEMIFVVDCSGSMSGAPIAKAKEAMRRCIAGMNPRDSFQIIRFSSAASKFSPGPLPNTPANIQKALTYIDSMSGSGGTMMIEGIKAALDYPEDPHRLRMVLFMTDGYIGNETEILSAIEQKLRKARLFSFGVGSSVNHYLLDRMAKTGRGTVQYVRPDEDTEKAVHTFYNRISNPLLTDITLHWSGVTVTDVYPPVIPDLFSAQPVIVHGRYDLPGTGAVIINARFRGSVWEQKIPVILPRREPENDVLAPLWARHRIKALMEDMHGGEKPDTAREITDLALKFRIMSRYTAFVAISEEIRRLPDGRMETVQIPVEMPEMVSFEGVFGDSLREKKYSPAAAPAGSVNSLIPLKTRECRDDNRIHTPGELTRPGYPVSQPLQRGQPALTYSVRMTSGSLTAGRADAALGKISALIEQLLSEFGTGKMVLEIRIEADGTIREIKALQNSFCGSGIMERLEKLLRNELILKEYPGTLTMELIRN
ncbi:VWA domain-containing protein [bacterium]|nr:VWA domain-containing protein [candidate division CSSED10-310 bacterium]